MGRTRKHTRRRPRANPHGVLTVHGGTFGFVRTAEGEYFIPESKMAGAFDGDLVEIAPLPARGAQKGAAEERPAARILRVIDRALRLGFPGVVGGGVVREHADDMDFRRVLEAHLVRRLKLEVVIGPRD